MSKRIVLPLLFFGVLLTGLAYGTDRLVPGQYTTIQAAIDAAVNGDTVIVSSGTYYESISFEGKNIVLRSTDPDDWDVVAATIIDANSIGRVVYIDANGTLEGLTIQNGNSDDGGGICAIDCIPTIKNCRVINNDGLSGGGIQVWSCIDGGEISNCVITGNNASEGGGIFCGVSSVFIRNCIIADNTAGSTGGGIYSSSASNSIRNCTIINNIASTGGGIYIAYDPLDITNCIVWTNTAGNGPQIYRSPGQGGDITHCDIQGGWTGTGNIDCYPYFADWNGKDYHLTWNSPCINRGDPSGSYTGQKDIDGEGRVAEERYVDARADIGADEMNRSNINLVPNPGFEDVDSNGWPVHWTNTWPSSRRVIDIADPNVHSGEYAWKFENNDIALQSGAYSDYIPVEPQSRYLLSGWVKSQTGHEIVYIGVVEFNSAKQDIAASYPVLEGVTVPTQWTNYEGYFQCQNPNTRYIRVRMFGPAQYNWLWWDDMSLLDMGQEQEFVAPYGLSNNNGSAQIDLGSSSEQNFGWLSPASALETTKQYDTGDENINYRSLIGKIGYTKTLRPSRSPCRLYRMLRLIRMDCPTVPCSLRSCIRTRSPTHHPVILLRREFSSSHESIISIWTTMLWDD